jgi:hypothetical protein
MADGSPVSQSHRKALVKDSKKRTAKSGSVLFKMPEVTIPSGSIPPEIAK